MFHLLPFFSFFSFFLIQINKNVCKVLNIKRLCAPYHSQTNGIVERMNYPIQRYNVHFHFLYRPSFKLILLHVLKHILINKQFIDIFSFFLEHCPSWWKTDLRNGTNVWTLSCLTWGQSAQMTTKFSPFFLTFGREARYPSQIPYEYRVSCTYKHILKRKKILNFGIMWPLNTAF